MTTNGHISNWKYVLPLLKQAGVSGDIGGSERPFSAGAWSLFFSRESKAEPFKTEQMM